MVEQENGCSKLNEIKRKDMEKFNGVAEKYFNSGQLKSRETYKNGKLNGLCEVWHRNGQLLARATYKGGNLEGLFEIWDRDGQLESRETYKDGVKTAVVN